MEVLKGEYGKDPLSEQLSFLEYGIMYPEKVFTFIYLLLSFSLLRPEKCLCGSHPEWERSVHAENGVECHNCHGENSLNLI